jgi:hypothetical protein
MHPRHTLSALAPERHDPVLVHRRSRRADEVVGACVPSRHAVPDREHRRDARGIRPIEGERAEVVHIGMTRDLGNAGTKHSLMDIVSNAGQADRVRAVDALGLERHSAGLRDRRDVRKEAGVPLARRRDDRELRSARHQPEASAGAS